MVDYAMDIHKSLYRSEDVPTEMVERRAEVVGRLKALEEAAAPLITFLQNPNAVQELRTDKQYNLQMLNDRYQIGPDQIEALYQYAKFQFECGNYSGAADYLYQYRALCTNNERNLSALWGKLAAEILMQNWDIALEELNHLKEIIDSKVSECNSNKCSHLLRYLATAFIVNKRRRPQFKEFIKVMLNDPFLGKRVEEGNFTSIPLRDEFLENARLFIFETYCRTHQRIDMSVLAEKLNLNYEEAERWIVNLIRTSKLEAKIDSETGTILMEPNHANVYEQLIDHTKALSGRTYKLVSQLLEHAQAQATRHGRCLLHGWDPPAASCEILAHTSAGSKMCVSDVLMLLFRCEFETFCVLVMASLMCLEHYSRE
ncbi:Eukaryotic translation initiation factor 3 subunit E [Sesamum angolense]|uniref:Eukaryotic translation initiation factor 3 subunit E n=1 Tax=Sesamum angolense TaxID=2727404 RepID=A0AAE1WFL9_9LAMI|nr:Eukaryotic translation initiation factor 3 subunit E [Sesamum angolense]